MQPPLRKEIELRIERGSERGPLFSEEDISELTEKLGLTTKFRPYLYGPFPIFTDAELRQFATFFFEVTKDISVALFASWLYDRLQQWKTERKIVAATLNGTPIQDRETLEKMLQTILERAPEQDHSGKAPNE